LLTATSCIIAVVTPASALKPLHPKKHLFATTVFKALIVRSPTIDSFGKRNSPPVKTICTRGSNSVKCITDKGVVCENEKGEEILIECQTAICALGQRSNTDMVNDLYDTAPYVSVIGDASKVSTITNAVYLGYHAALDI